MQWARTVALLAVLMSMAACQEASPARRVVAIGDVHGDLPQLIAVLQMSEVVDRAGRWIANSTTTVVQVGDLLDRGPHDKEVMDFFINLKTDAMRHGAKVINLLGNHELMNLGNQLHYVHPESHEAFGGKHHRRKAFAADGIYGQFLRTFPIMHVESRTLFVHAGLLPRHARKGVAALNAEARQAILQGDLDHPIFKTDGPVWTRLLVTDATNGRCGDVDETLRLLDLDRMVIGHTPQRSGRLGSFCDDKLIAIDVGLSKWMYGKLAALEMTVLDDEGRNVELREVLSRKVGAETDDDDTENGGGASEIVNDPMLLQEMLDVLHEYEGRKKMQAHDEL